MKALVVGGNGLLGTALVAAVHQVGWNVIATTRRTPIPRGGIYLDLSERIPDLPACNVTFVVAAVATYRACEGDAKSFRANVDGPIEVIRQVLSAGLFSVYVSSDAVEWSNSAYARQKAYVESVFRLSNVAILRPGKITKETAPDVCQRLIEIGEARKPGIFHWP